MSDYIGDYIHYRIEKSDQAYKDAFLFDSRQKGDYGDMYDFDVLLGLRNKIFDFPMPFALQALTCPRISDK